MSEVAHDRRLLRGAKSRQTIVRRAVDVASLDGLDGLSFGRLATDLGVSKGGIQTLFGTKENLQLAVVEAAREAFRDAVIRPALVRPPGVERLSVLADRWIAYAEEPLFSGGCFWAANLPVFDSRPGPVRDTLARQQRAWRGLLAAELRHAADAGEIAAFDADLAAFQIVAIVSGPNLRSLDAVGAAQRGSGAQDAGDLGEETVLEGSGRYVVEHGEADRAGEAVRRKGHIGGVGVHHLHVGSGQAIGQSLGQRRVELHRRQPQSPGSHQVGCHAGAGPISRQSSPRSEDPSTHGSSSSRTVAAHSGLARYRR